MPKVSDEYLEQRRQQVLDAATACFARRGFAATTIKDIAQAAGVSYGVVYHYFDSKEAIVAAGSMQSEEQRAARFAQAEQHKATADVLAEYLRSSLSRWQNASSAPEINVRVQVMAESAIDESVRAITGAGIEDYQRRLAAIVRRGQERGEIAADVDPAAAALVLLAVNEGLVALKAVDRSLDVGSYLETAIKLVEGRFLTEAGKERRNDRADDRSARTAGRRGRRTA